jgi:hypothetical protein
MKKLYLVLALMSMIAMGDVGEKKTEPPMTCFPTTLVKKWQSKKPKKVVKAPAPAPAPVIVEKQVIVEKTIVKEAPKNNVSLLGGRTETGLQGSNIPPNYQARTTGQVDVGLMYQRRLNDKFRAMFIGTMNGSFYGGVGYDF